MHVPEGWIISKGPESFQSSGHYDDSKPSNNTPPSSSKHIKQPLTFLGLPTIVVRLILEEKLDRASIKEFRLVSSACRRLSEPVIFRTLILHNRNLSFHSVVASICGRLCDPEDTLGEIVHHLQVGPQQQKECYPEEDTILKSVENISHLRDFTWHMRIAIPEALLELLHRKHASTRIHVVNNDRLVHLDQFNVNITPDYKTLSSAQLYSLEYTVYGEKIQTNRPEWDTYSEMPAIKECLLKARNLKKLELEYQESRLPRQNNWKRGSPYLSFENGERLPPLEELAFRSGISHSVREAMDWTKLRRLQLDQSCPVATISIFTGKVPQLKVLFLGIVVHAAVLANEIDLLRSFFNSIDELEEVTVLDHPPHLFEKIRDQFFSKHGHNLKRLYMPSGTISSTELEDLAQRCPKIQDLWVRVAEDTHPFDARLKLAVSALQRLKDLRKLEVHFDVHRNIRLNQDDTDIIQITWIPKRSHDLMGHYAYELKEQMWREHVVSIYEGFHSIESLRITLGATAWPSCNWVFWVQRQYDDRKKFRVLKNFLQPAKVYGMPFDPWG